VKLQSLMMEQEESESLKPKSSTRQKRSSNFSVKIVPLSLSGKAIFVNTWNYMIELVTYLFANSAVLKRFDKARYGSTK
jgi:hypothetical protein